MTGETEALPVDVLTGFLGSGKTTLLRHLLGTPKFRDTAVLINEFGEVGLDHLLVEKIDEATVLLQSGCICCTIRGDLSDALRGLYSRRERGAIPWFRRIAIETTGLADPSPVMATILHDPVLQHHLSLGHVIATVDAACGLTSLENHPEAVKQATVADRLVVTKTDICDERAVRKLRSALRQLNPIAPIFEVCHGEIDGDALFLDSDPAAAARIAEVRRWLEVEHAADDHAHDHDHARPLDRNRHARGIRSFCIVLDSAIEWSAFGIWLTMLLNCHGNDVLRVKGVLNIAGSDRPVVVHGVQHLVHPPSHLDDWPFEDRRSRLVFIVRELDEAAIRSSLQQFQALGRTLEAVA